jgi:proline iminopeptidase
MVCPPISAYQLADGWEKARLTLVPMAGHALSEPAISAALVAAMDGLIAQPSKSPRRSFFDD